MKPLPWSYSSLDTFKSCPRKFEALRVSKSVVEEKGDATVWGEVAHKHFEERLRDGTALPDTLTDHEPYLARLVKLPGEAGVEQKIALNRKMQPCGFFDADVWYRGVIDYTKVNRRTGHALLIDHKFGKPHSKFAQLKLFALWTFAAHADVETAEVRYYWAKERREVSASYTRDMIPHLWGEFVPDLKQYAEAFREEIWQPRQSGLCGWCPVTDCEFWRPKRSR